ncbi:hypothetical protein V5O48_000826 [Marasmius crinis-equi]|uniref:F-box domain-containing protein n=1 Tax=Marasmius crinis-equi TaxID=585013 RepID=A0ABR3G076_9AGAR
MLSGTYWNAPHKDVFVKLNRASAVEILRGILSTETPESRMLSNSPTLWQPTLLCPKCRDEFVPSPIHVPLSTDALHSKCIPTEMESKQTALFIQDEERVLARYDKEIERFHHVAASLERERKALTETILHRRSWKSAVRRLPVEILDEIFTEVCLGTRDDDYALSIHPGSTEDILAPTVTLSQVCSRWREITHDLPHLWSTLSINIYRILKDVNPLIQLYSKNARDTPLDIFLQDSGRDCGSGPEDDPMGYLGKFGCAAYRLVMKQLHRCRKLKIDLQPKILSIAVDPWFQLNLSFPRLETFHNGLDDDDDDDNMVEAPDWFRDALYYKAPKLVHAETHYLTSLTETIFRCPVLTSLKVTVCLSPELLGVFLFESPLLQRLEIEDLNFSDINPFLAPPHVVLPALRTLSLTSGYAYDMAVIFRSVTLPSLDSLTINVRSHNINTAHYGLLMEQMDFQLHLLTMLERSACQLKKLNVGLNQDGTLGAIGLSWQRLFAACSSLTEFHLSQFDWLCEPLSTSFCDLLTVLTDSYSAPPSLPNLRKLDIRAQITESFEENVIGMLESWRLTRSGLEADRSLKASFRLRKSNSGAVACRSWDVERRVAELKKEGIACVFK